MKKQTLFVALTLLVTPLAADLADEVKCREIGFSQSVEERNIKAFESFIDADARFVGGYVSRGPDQIVAAWSVFFSDEGPRIKWRPQIVEVLDDGKLALSRGPYRMISKDADGNDTESWGTFNSIWRMQADDTWKVVFDAGNASESRPAQEVRDLFDEVIHCP